jgi:hypothetical protein
MAYHPTEWAAPCSNGGGADEQNSKTMKLEQMELALARFDVIIGILKKQIEEGNPQGTLRCHLKSDGGERQAVRSPMLRRTGSFMPRSTCLMFC